MAEINIPTEEQIKNKVKQYFDIDFEFNLQEELENFSHSKEAGTIPVYSEYYAYDAGNPWGIVLKSITFSEKKKQYTVRLESMANQSTGRLERITYVTLKEREDKSLYYTSVRYEYPETNLVKIEGDYKTLDPQKFGAENVLYSIPIQVYGTDAGGSLLLKGELQKGNFYDPLAAELTFSIYSPFEDKVRYSMKLPQKKDSWLHNVRILEDKLIFKMNDSFYATGFNLQKKGKSIELPDVVKTVLADKDRKGAYDVSADMKKIIYTNKDGLFMYNLESGVNTKLASHLTVNNKLFDISYIVEPAFTVGDKAVISKLSGYEGYYGLLALNPDKPGDVHIYREMEAIDALNYTNIRYPMVNIRSREKPASSGNPSAGTERTFDIEVLDFEKLAASPDTARPEPVTVDFEDERSQQFRASLDNVPVYNGNYMAYIAEKPITQFVPEEQEYYIVRVDLATMKAETLLTIKAGTPVIRAITRDGRVMASYHFERESGLIITGK